MIQWDKERCLEGYIGETGRLLRACLTENMWLTKPQKELLGHILISRAKAYQTWQITVLEQIKLKDNIGRNARHMLYIILGKKMLVDKNKSEQNLGAKKLGENKMLVNNFFPPALTPPSPWWPPWEKASCPCPPSVSVQDCGILQSLSWSGTVCEPGRTRWSRRGARGSA